MRHLLPLGLFVTTVAVVVGCRTQTPLPVEPPRAETTTTSAELPQPNASNAGSCVLECGSAQVAQLPAIAPDRHAAAVRNANEVIAAMHDDLLACYKTRLAQNPNAHASLVVEVVVNYDGTVLYSDVTGGAMLGRRGLRCITTRIERAKFAPVHGGGTMRLEIPLIFRRGDAPDAT
jgi:hypothetical protein